MYQVVWQEGEKIEIGLDGDLTQDEFRQVIHQLQSLCTGNHNINVLLDASNLKKYDFKIVMDEYEFYQKYKTHLNRVALVSDSRFADFAMNVFNKFTDTEFKKFRPQDIEQARKWIFPSRLP